MKYINNEDSVRRALRRLKNDPLNSFEFARETFKNADLSITDRRNENLKIPYFMAQQAENDANVMRSFLSHNFWDGNGHRPKPKDILIRAFEFCLECTVRKGALYDRCWTYASAVKPFFEAKAPFESLPALIQKGGGIEALARPRPDSVVDTPTGDDQGQQVNDQGGDTSALGQSPVPASSTQGLQRGAAAQGSKGQSNGTSRKGARGGPQPKVDLTKDFVLNGAAKDVEFLMRNIDAQEVFFEAKITERTENYVRLEVTSVQVPF